MKKILLTILSIGISLSIYAGTVSEHGQLKVQGVHLLDKNNQPVVLRGVSFGWSNWYGKFYNAQAIDWLVSDWKCKVVRAAIGIEPDGAYISKPQLHTELAVNVIESAIRNDIYVIIDWHSHGIRTQEAVEFFRKMAIQYGKYPNIIYEIFNEPVHQTWEEVKTYSETVIQAIREIDKNNIILVGSPHWDQDIHIAADSPITGYENLMYSLHFYAATHKEDLRCKADYALSKGLPLFVSECAAMEASGDGNLDKDSWNNWLNWMETNKLSWACWSLSSKNETCSMIKDDSVDPKGLWSDSDLKEWGKVVRETLRAKEGKMQNQMIETPTPPRPAGQTDVLQLRAKPIPVVRMAFIGLGMRGPDAVERMTHIDGVKIVALCDVEKDRVESANEILKKRGLPEAQMFYGDEEVWRKVTALPNVDLIYVATDWKHHAPIGIQAMKDGKHVAIEVPAATNMQEIWDLINTSEQTRKHCMQLENCVYDFFELTTLNMVQQGLLGDIIHGEGAYIHGLQPFWDQYWHNWRMDFNRTHRGDVYPTHGLGPVCQAMNIHRGDKLNYLVSIDTKPIGNPAYIKEKTGETVTDFRNGDHTCTLIATEKGKSILIEHNVTSPRPYNRMYQLTGTKGFANKYPVPGFALEKEEIGAEITADYQNLNAHSFVPDTVRNRLMQKYKHPIAVAIEEKAKEVGGHGGMDFIMDYRLIYCLQKGLPLDMDVYDLAEWCCLVPLTEISLDNNSMPVQIPDFTRGAWNKLSKLTFAE